MCGSGDAAPRRRLLRLFTVQGSWNYERMLGIGFGVAEEPLVRGLPRDEYRAAIVRSAHFFNAHPYLCGMAVGAAARAEHDGVPAEQVERLRTALCGPLGSLGDRLVWAGWLPFNSGLALVGIALGWGWWAIAGFLAIYNVGHVGLRWWALRAGWAHGIRVVDALRHPLLRRAGALLGPAMAVAMGAVAPHGRGVPGGSFPWLGARRAWGGGCGRGPVIAVASAGIDGSAPRTRLCRRRHRGGVRMAVIDREALIVNPLGMHARPAAELVKVANRFKATITVRRGDLAVNGKSIMGVMMLAAECGSSIHIKADGGKTRRRRWTPCWPWWRRDSTRWT